MQRNMLWDCFTISILENIPIIRFAMTHSISIFNSAPTITDNFKLSLIASKALVVNLS